MTRNALISSFLALAMGVGSVLPATAAPLVVQKPAGATQMSDVVDVQYRRRGNQHRRGFYSRNGRHYYGGHRVYRRHRPGYHRYNGYWVAPATALALGLIIGGVASQPSAPPARARSGASNPRHSSWCHSRYRSYRDWDNSFQPYHGPRKQCYSPYY